jgi:cytochrome c biogenesis protein CcmG, thiol:disulfide interchange protein DsbE
LNHTGQAMGFRITKMAVIGVLVAAICAAAVVYAVSSSENSGDPGAANPESAAADYDAALAGAPKPLADLYARGDALLDGGRPAFEAQLDELRGYPVVVNKWASWCGPCRFEFPLFQSQAAKRGTEVAFLGVDSDDSPDAAETFLDELPLPYPSFSDPDQEIARLFDAREFPSTAYYDADGELVYVRRGGYAAESELAADIDRYAR